MGSAANNGGTVNNTGSYNTTYDTNTVSAGNNGSAANNGGTVNNTVVLQHEGLLQQRLEHPQQLGYVVWQLGRHRYRDERRHSHQQQQPTDRQQRSQQKQQQHRQRHYPRCPEKLGGGKRVVEPVDDLHRDQHDHHRKWFGGNQCSPVRQQNAQNAASSSASGQINMSYSMNGQGILQANLNTGAASVQGNSVAQLIGRRQRRRVERVQPEHPRLLR